MPLAATVSGPEVGVKGELPVRLWFGAYGCGVDMDTFPRYKIKNNETQSQQNKFSQEAASARGSR